MSVVRECIENALRDSNTDCIITYKINSLYVCRTKYT